MVAATVDLADPRRPKRARHEQQLFGIASIVGVLLGWTGISVLAGTSPLTGERLVPNLFDIAAAYPKLANYWRGGFGLPAVQDGGTVDLVTATAALVDNSLATLFRLLAGLGIGLSAAVGLAIVLSWSETTRRMFHLPANLARMIPLVALSPLFNLWFGNSDLGSIVFVAFASFAIVFILATTSIGNVPAFYLDYASSLGAGRWRTYLTVVVPAALPNLRSGVLLALGFGWSMVIASEFLGQTVGLGNIVNRAQYFGQTTTLALVAVIAIIYAAVTLKVVSWAFGRLVQWSE
jgi:sulfonate transport system permease protein